MRLRLVHTLVSQHPLLQTNANAPISILQLVLKALVHYECFRERLKRLKQTITYKELILCFSDHCSRCNRCLKEELCSIWRESVKHTCLAHLRGVCCIGTIGLETSLKEKPTPKFNSLSTFILAPQNTIYDRLRPTTRDTAQGTMTLLIVLRENLTPLSFKNLRQFKEN